MHSFSVVDVPKELKSVKCYDCSFYIRGTEREGNEACEFIDPLVNEPEAGMVECKGYCVVSKVCYLLQC